MVYMFSVWFDIEGMDSRYFDFYDPPPDVTLLDLDTNSVTVFVLIIFTVRFTALSTCVIVDINCA